MVTEVRWRPSCRTWSLRVRPAGTGSPRRHRPPSAGPGGRGSCRPSARAPPGTAPAAAGARARRCPDRRASPPDQGAAMRRCLRLGGMALRDHPTMKSLFLRLHLPAEGLGHQSARSCGRAQSTVTWKVSADGGTVRRDQALAVGEREHLVRRLQPAGAAASRGLVKGRAAPVRDTASRRSWLWRPLEPPVLVPKRDPMLVEPDDEGAQRREVARHHRSTSRRSSSSRRSSTRSVLVAQPPGNPGRQPRPRRSPPPTGRRSWLIEESRWGRARVRRSGPAAWPHPCPGAR